MAHHWSEGTIATKLIHAIEELSKLGPDVEPNTMILFLMVGVRPGIRMKELEKASGLSSSAVSRNVLALSSRGYKKGPDGKFPPGLDLMITATDPFDVRAKVASLTPKGRKVFERIVGYLKE